MKENQFLAQLTGAGTGSSRSIWNSGRAGQTVFMTVSNTNCLKTVIGKSNGWLHEGSKMKQALMASKKQTAPVRNEILFACFLGSGFFGDWLFCRPAFSKGTLKYLSFLCFFVSSSHNIVFVLVKLTSFSQKMRLYK